MIGYTGYIIFSTIITGNSTRWVTALEGNSTTQVTPLDNWGIQQTQNTQKRLLSCWVQGTFGRMGTIGGLDIF